MSFGFLRAPGVDCTTKLTFKTWKIVRDFALGTFSRIRNRLAAAVISDWVTGG